MKNGIKITKALEEDGFFDLSGLVEWAKPSSFLARADYDSVNLLLSIANIYELSWSFIRKIGVAIPINNKESTKRIKGLTKEEAVKGTIKVTKDLKSDKGYSLYTDESDERDTSNDFVIMEDTWQLPQQSEEIHNDIVAKLTKQRDDYKESFEHYRDKYEDLIFSRNADISKLKEKHSKDIDDCLYDARELHAKEMAELKQLSDRYLKRATYLEKKYEPIEGEDTI